MKKVTLVCYLVNGIWDRREKGGGGRGEDRGWDGERLVGDRGGRGGVTGGLR